MSVRRSPQIAQCPKFLRFATIVSIGGRARIDQCDAAYSNFLVEYDAVVEGIDDPAACVKAIQVILPKVKDFAWSEHTRDPTKQLKTNELDATKNHAEQVTQLTEEIAKIEADLQKVGDRITEDIASYVGGAAGAYVGEAHPLAKAHAKMSRELRVKKRTLKKTKATLGSVEGVRQKAIAGLDPMMNLWVQDNELGHRFHLEDEAE